MAKNFRVCKNFTYYTIIKEAINAEKDKRATTNQIFTYITNKHSHLFKQSNSMTWKSNIRQLLSKNPEFVKLQKDDISKLHYWKHVPIEEIMEYEKNDLRNREYLPYTNYYNPDLSRFKHPAYNPQNNSVFPPMSYYPQGHEYLYNPNQNDNFGNFINNFKYNEPQARYEPNFRFDTQPRYNPNNIYDPNYEAQARYNNYDQQARYNPDEPQARYNPDEPQARYQPNKEPEIHSMYTKSNTNENNANNNDEPNPNIDEHKSDSKSKKNKKLKKSKKSRSKRFNCSEIFGDIENNELISDDKIFSKDSNNIIDEINLQDTFLYDTTIQGKKNFNYNVGLIRPDEILKNDQISNLEEKRTPCKSKTNKVNNLLIKSTDKSSEKHPPSQDCFSEKENITPDY